MFPEFGPQNPGPSVLVMIGPALARVPALIRYAMSWTFSPATDTAPHRFAPADVKKLAARTLVYMAVYMPLARWGLGSIRSALGGTLLATLATMLGQIYSAYLAGPGRPPTPVPPISPDVSPPTRPAP